METKKAAALIIFDNKGRVLFAKRGPKKWPFPNVLSLPSSDIEKDENEKKKIVSATKRKLGFKVKILGILGRKKGIQKETGNRLVMTDYIAKIEKGKIKPNKSDYTKAVFLEPKKTLLRLKKEKKLGFCTKILLYEFNKNPDFFKKYRI